MPRQKQEIVEMWVLEQVCEEPNLAAQLAAVSQPT